MASRGIPTGEPEKAAPPPDFLVVADVILRLLLLVFALVAVVVLVTSEQTEYNLPAKFNYSPAFVYFVAALSVAGFYGLTTAAVSFLALQKLGRSTKLLNHFVIFDVLMLAIVATAGGAAAGVAYIGLEGNSHIGWSKICDIYDKFCHHVEASLAFSLFATNVLVLLIILSVYSLSKRIPK